MVDMIHWQSAVCQANLKKKLFRLNGETSILVIKVNLDRNLDPKTIIRLLLYFIQGNIFHTGNQEKKI